MPDAHVLLLERRKYKNKMKFLCKYNKNMMYNEVTLCRIMAVSSLQECDDMLKCLLYFLVFPDNR